MGEAFVAATEKNQVPQAAEASIDFDSTGMNQTAESGFADSGAENTLGSLESPTASFGERAKAFFSGMSEKGKAVAEKMYEGIYKIPGVQRMAGKMEIAFNQYFVDRHEGKAINLRTQAETIGPQVEAMRLAAAETSTAIETLRNMGAPGLSGLERKAMELDQKRLDLLLTQESLNQQADARVGKMEHFKSKRDMVADRLIGIYGEKMAPIERRVESLGNNLDLAETQAALTRAEHEQQLRTLTDLEGRRNKIAQLLGSAGLSEKDVQRQDVIKLIDKQIAAGREKVRAEDEKIERSMTSLSGRIAGANAKVQGYRSRQQEFQNLKRRTLSPEQLGVSTPPETVASGNGTKNGESTNTFEDADEEETVSETLKRLDAYLEDSPNSRLTREQKIDRLGVLMEADPDIHEFFQNIFDESLSNDERERYVEILNKTGYPFKNNMQGLDIRLPGNDRSTLVIESPDQKSLSARIVKQNV